MKKLIRISVLAAILSLAFVLPSQAVPMEGTGYTIPALVISSGGHTSLEAQGSYKLHDLKGQSVIGVSTDNNNYTVYLGGIYAVSQGIVEGNWPYGTCPLYVSRQGDDIKISWEAAIKSPDIYVLTGEGTGTFVDDSASWKLYTDSSFSGQFDDTHKNEGYILHLAQIGSAATLVEIYYRGLQVGILPAEPNPQVTGKTYLASAWAAGKLNLKTYKINNSAWNFVAAPVFASNLDEVFGTDFTQGDQLWFWDDSNQKFFSPVTFDGSTWGTSANLVRGNGVLFNLAGTSPKTVTLLGQVSLESFSREIAVKAGTPSYGWNVIGNPFPILSSMEGLIAGKSVQGDSLWEWNDAQQKFLAPLTFDGTAWPVGTELKIGKAYGYNHLGNGFTWDIPAK